MVKKIIGKRIGAIALAAVLAATAFPADMSLKILADEQTQETNYFVDGDLGDDSADDLWKNNVWNFDLAALAYFEFNCSFPFPDALSDNLSKNPTPPKISDIEPNALPIAFIIPPPIWSNTLFAVSKLNTPLAFFPTSLSPLKAVAIAPLGPKNFPSYILAIKLSRQPPSWKGYNYGVT